MRILWFSNTPSLAASKISKSTSGSSWIESLEKELGSFPDIELGIVFKKHERSPREIDLESSNTRYFLVPEYPMGKIQRWISRCFSNTTSKKSLPHYLNVVKDFNPDVILFFGTEFDYPLIIPELNVPSIIWFQGNLTVYNKMYENGISIRKTYRFESIKKVLKCYTEYHNHRLFQHRVTREKEIFSIATNFIGRTNWDKRVVRIMAPQANYFHCEEALREAFWNYKWKTRKNRTKYVIATVIRGQLYKGLETIYETAIHLEEKLSRDIEWHVIGIENGTTYAKTAKKQAAYDKPNCSVKLLGPKFGNDLVELLLETDMYVHPSHIENSSNAVQEAMLLGMPVIATNVGGTPSLINDGHDGLLIQSKDTYAMAGAILELIESPEKSKELGRNARLRGLQRNDNQKICKELITIFETVIAQNKFNNDHK